MERHERPPASDVEAWLAQELAFLYDVERRILRRAATLRRTRWVVAAVALAGICYSVWVLVEAVAKS